MLSAGLIAVRRGGRRDVRSGTCHSSVGGSLRERIQQYIPKVDRFTELTGE